MDLRVIDADGDELREQVVGGLDVVLHGDHGGRRGVVGGWNKEEKGIVTRIKKRRR